MPKKPVVKGAPKATAPKATPKKRITAKTPAPKAPVAPPPDAVLATADPIADIVPSVDNALEVKIAGSAFGNWKSRLLTMLAAAHGTTVTLKTPAHGWVHGAVADAVYAMFANLVVDKRADVYRACSKEWKAVRGKPGSPSCTVFCVSFYGGWTAAVAKRLNQTTDLPPKATVDVPSFEAGYAAGMTAPLNVPGQNAVAA